MRSEILAEAVAALRAGQAGRALALVAPLLQRDPADADALTVRGMALQATGAQDDAIAAMRAAHEADPGNPARAVNLGLMLKAGGRHDQAVAMLQHAVAARPQHGPSLANLGSCLIAAERAGEAVPVLEQAVALTPQDAGAHNNLGVAMARSGHDEAALQHYAAALALRPAFHESRLNRADALRRLKRTKDALADARAVLAADPAHQRAANIAGMVSEALGDDDAAIAIWRAALDRGTSHPVGVNLMRLLLKRGRAEEVPPVARRLLDAQPGSTTPLAYLVAALDRMGDGEARDRLGGDDRFVKIIDIAPPPGFAALSDFNAALESELRADPSLTFEPEGLVTRKGRQSADLAEARTPALAALARFARDALADHAASLDDEGGRDFLAARPAEWSLTLWGTLLGPGGSVDPHIHAPNWLSGVYYPSDMPGTQDEGAFAIGLLPEELGGGGTARIIRPRAGRMILFPSFLWHGTLPFPGSEERISLAFDMVPEGVGRPHRLPR
ncbi:2OG-Fe(II) oxygenase family protein [Croceicoccus marinus]|uniref:Tetratricopeptide repeat protein n=1 Tax=Croceicoccus marinus TaxID=450378 RepID=A0A7G6W0B2_9SPHN|nr:putative 2OG-Fe(II) oxygenase [Croceicoccus marinus]QNE07427.1 tetratricopeptide repeat protein [Croceicoccus marinus]